MIPKFKIPCLQGTIKAELALKIAIWMLSFILRNSCPGCRENRSHELLRCPFAQDPIYSYLKRSYAPAFFDEIKEGSYILDECEACGLIFQKSILNETGLKKLYEVYTGHSTPKNKLELSKEIDCLQELLILINYFNLPPHQLSFLDFGMGDCKWLSLSKALGCQASGYDLSEMRNTEAVQKGLNILDKSGVRNSRFDFINTEQVMEHISHPLDALIELKESLKPGGLIKISVPNGKNIKKKLQSADWSAKKGSKKDLNPIAPFEHINCFSYDTILRMAKSAGLRKVSLPLSLQYRYSLQWNTFKWFRKNLIKPIKRNYLKRGTYLFFAA